MHILTIMNYRKMNYILMCKMWIYLAKRFNPHASITILHSFDIPDIQEYAKKRFSNIQFQRLNISKIPTQRDMRGFTHQGQEYKLAVWKYTQYKHISKYIFVDADALILSSLNQWWSAIDRQPYIAVTERMFHDVPIINTGVYGYNTKSHFITYSKLLQQYQRDNNRIRLPVGDQGLINAYFHQIHYDATNRAIGHEYNSFAKFCKVKTVNDKNIIIYSGDYPIRQTIKRLLLRKRREWWEDWFWWNKPKRIKIIHAYGHGPYKYWNLPECAPLWNYCITKIT